MLREIVKIDEEKCNGCGLCIPNCHEGALQIIDGKARLISDLMCDGLGACIGHCPEGAMEIEKREAEPYDEIKVIAEMIEKGMNTVIAHMKHLKDHREFGFLKEAVRYLTENAETISFPVTQVIQEVHLYSPNSGESTQSNKSQKIEHTMLNHTHSGGGCPGSRSMSFASAPENIATTPADSKSELTQWPVQMHLINPAASHFSKSDLLLAADCVAFSMGNFHSEHLKGKSLAIACPKLDNNQEIYKNKLIALIDDSKINTITVMKMEVPCCSGIERLAIAAVESASRKVPVKSLTVGVRGEIIGEEWL